MRISTVQLWVRDQEEARAFYTENLDMEVRQDITERRRTGLFRWLTVAPPGQDVTIALIASALAPADLRHQALNAIENSASILLATEDCRATYRRLRARGVRFYEAPQQRTYGIDAGLLDPSGNNIRLVQLRAQPS